MIVPQLAKDTEISIVIDDSPRFQRIIKLLIRGRVQLFQLCRLGFAEFSRESPAKLKDSVTLKVRNNADLELLIKTLKPSCLIMFRVGMIINPRVLSLGVPIFNLHCARLPEFGGLDAIHKARLSSENFHFATLHRVGSQIDRGEVLDTEPYSLSGVTSQSEAEARAYAAGMRLLKRQLQN